MAKDDTALTVKVEKANDALVTKAFNEIKELYHQKTHETVYALGECLKKHFYEDDLENIRKNKPVDGKSLNKLASECENEIGGLSKSWLYASVNLVVDREDMEGCKEYEGLSVSHKFQLLSVPNVKDKKKLSKDILKIGLSVRGTIEIIRQDFIEQESEESDKKTRNKTLKSLIKQPFLLADPDYKDIKSRTSLKKLKKEDRDTFLKDAEEEIEKVKG